VSDPGAAPPEGPGQWQHLHPLSPLLRGGVAFVAVVGYVLSQQVERLFRTQGSDAGSQDPTQGHRLLALAVAGVVLLAIVGGAWVSWRVSRFRIGSAFVELRRGLLFREHRQVPFDRIQAVDISRPVLARLTGLSEVVVRSAGGRGSHITLAFLSDARAQEVRERLMELAGRADEVTSGAAGSVARSTADGAVTPAAERMASALVVRVPNVRLVQAAVFSSGTAFLLAAVPALLVGFALGLPQLVGWLGPMVLGVAGRHVRSLVREANFTLDHRGDRLVVHRGLTELRSTTVPLHRIQAAGLVQPLFWRWPGWWRLRVNVAGVHEHGEQDTETMLLPVGTLPEALAVLALVRPELPAELAVVAVTRSGAGHGFTTAPSRAWVLDPVGWRRRGYAVTPDSLVLRSGVLRREAQVVPHARIQGVAVRQGLVQRWRGVATVRLGSTPGPVRTEVAHLGLADAERLLREQRARSSRARRRLV
jgi:putative membrane protein